MYALLALRVPLNLAPSISLPIVMIGQARVFVLRTRRNVCMLSAALLVILTRPVASLGCLSEVRWVKSVLLLTTTPGRTPLSRCRVVLRVRLVA